MAEFPWKVTPLSKKVTVRLEEALIEGLEAVRDPDRFPTQSDFIRETIRRMVREERRNRVRAEVARLSQDQEEMARLANLADERATDLSERLDRADRGEL